VLDTTAGKVVEKRITSNVMRRRHAEPAPGEAPPPRGGEPFHFEAESAGSEETFVAPFLDEPPPVADIPEGFDVELPSGVNGGLAAEEQSAEVAPDGREADALEDGPGEEAERAPHAEHEPSQTEASTPAAQQAAPQRTGTAPESARPRPASPPVVSRPPGQEHSGGARVLNLTRTGRSAPTLDDTQQGPKVLGKIDLRKPAARPATQLQRPAMPSRPGGPPRPARPSTGPAPEMPAVPPSDVQKPGARTIKKKRVVKKEPGDFLSEREMRGSRFPKKRRALPGKEQRHTEITTPKASKRVVRVSEGVTVADLARNMGVKAGELIKKLMALGVMSTMNQVLDVDTATLVASEFGYNVENVAFDVESAIEEDVEVAAGESMPRPPVVTVMGHVDHGKTSLLDAIRHTNVTAEEHGGITQHIGAYTVEANGKKISFVDTPGHEAFTSMRARGAKVTDIVVLVVAADEGVMPQTIEALNHARAAKVPVIVAVNKIDRPEANLDRVKQQLSEHGLIPEDYGGDIITVPVSARTREGLDKLLEMILLQADLLELKATPDRLARGTVVEAQLDRGRGPVATVLVQEGTLRQGDPFVCGVSYGRVRAMADYQGRKISEAGPSIPVEVFGLSSVPEPGAAFVVVADESKARQVAEYRQGKQREGELQKTSRLSLEELSEKMKAGEVKELKVIVKGDTLGSVEALSDALQRLSTGEVKLDVIHGSAGGVSETDVSLASASRAIIVAFNVRPEQKANALAEAEGVDIRPYTIIYEAIDEMREAMEGLLAPTLREKQVGRAEVRQIFSTPGGTVGGSMVLDGKITRAARCRVVRDSRVAWEGRIGSLRRFKDDVREVQSGYECGIVLENFGDIKPGDIIECFEMESVTRKLETPKSPSARSQVVAEKQL
jgi:translation initiation factor IF-2